MIFDEESGGQTVGQTGGQTLLCLQLWYFFFSYKLPKTVKVTMLLLFGHVMLFVRHFLYLVE